MVRSCFRCVLSWKSTHVITFHYSTTLVNNIKVLFVSVMWITNIPAGTYSRVISIKTVWHCTPLVIWLWDRTMILAWNIVLDTAIRTYTLAKTLSIIPRVEVDTLVSVRNTNFFCLLQIEANKLKFITSWSRRIAVAYIIAVSFVSFTHHPIDLKDYKRCKVLENTTNQQVS